MFFKPVIKLFRTPMLFFLKLYWFIFRPETRGVKIVLTHKDEVLFIKHTYLKGYGFPGGGIKKNESLEKGIRREVREEVGVDLGAVKFLGDFVSTSEYKKDHVFVYTAELPNKDLKINNLELEEAHWFPKSKIPKLGPVGTKIISLYMSNFSYFLLKK